MISNTNLRSVTSSEPKLLWERRQAAISFIRAATALLQPAETSVGAAPSREFVHSRRNGAPTASRIRCRSCNWQSCNANVDLRATIRALG